MAFTTKGASCYASVPSGTALPYFIRAFNDSGFSFKHLLVWVKQHFVLGMSDYQHRHEAILYGWIENGPHYFVPDRTQSSVFEIDRPSTSSLHPTTKPIALIAEMIQNSSRPDEIIYDPFCGSGSTIIAAAQLKRIGYGCELDPGYVAVELEEVDFTWIEAGIEELIYVLARLRWPFSQSQQTHRRVREYGACAVGRNRVGKAEARRIHLRRNRGSDYSGGTRTKKCRSLLCRKASPSRQNTRSLRWGVTKLRAARCVEHPTLKPTR